MHELSYIWQSENARIFLFDEQMRDPEKLFFLKSHRTLKHRPFRQTLS